MKYLLNILLILLVSAASVYGTYLYLNKDATTAESGQRELIPSDKPKPDKLADWKTITIGDIVDFKIPENCNTEGAAGSTYITCPTPDNETPPPEMVISSDGMQINVRRWENMESPYWDDIISSLRVHNPISRSIQINID